MNMQKHEVRTFMLKLLVMVQVLMHIILQPLAQMEQVVFLL